jgi:hypothetical protein
MSGAAVQSLDATRSGARDFSFLVLGLFDGALAFLDNVLLRMFFIVICLNYLFHMCVCVCVCFMIALDSINSCGNAMESTTHQLKFLPAYVPSYVVNYIQDSANMAFMIRLVHISFVGVLCNSYYVIF